VQRPVTAFARFLVVAGDLDEAVVETEVVAYGVLPSLLVLPVEGETFHDELIDAVQRGLLFRRSHDGHCYESNVAVGWLDHVLRARGCTVHGRVGPGSGGCDASVGVVAVPAGGQGGIAASHALPVVGVGRIEGGHEAEGASRASGEGISAGSDGWIAALQSRLHGCCSCSLYIYM
jgi:hypothetical protein